MSIEWYEAMLEDLFEKHLELMVNVEGWPRNSSETVSQAQERARNELSEGR